jgi:hypothetical protein
MIFATGDDFRSFVASEGHPIRARTRICIRPADRGDHGAVKQGHDGLGHGKAFSHFWSRAV